MGRLRLAPGHAHIAARRHSGMDVPLDGFGLQILRAVQQDGRLSVNDLAKRIGLSTSPTWRPLRAWEERGVIRRDVALLDPALAGVPRCVFTHATPVKRDRAAIADFEAAVRSRPEVLECFAATGDANRLLRVMVADAAAFERFLQGAIFSLPAVHQARSNFALRQVKFETALPVG